MKNHNNMETIPFYFILNNISAFFKTKEIYIQAYQLTSLEILLIIGVIYDDVSMNCMCSL